MDWDDVDGLMPKCWAQESPRAQSAEMQAWIQGNLWAGAGFTLSGVRAETSVEPLPVPPKKIGRFIQSFTWSLRLTERGLCLQSNIFFLKENNNYLNHISFVTRLKDQLVKRCFFPYNFICSSHANLRPMSHVKEHKW